MKRPEARASGNDSSFSAERERVLLAYDQRKREIAQDRYAPWRAPGAFINFSRLRAAAEMLHESNVFPAEGNPCLEIGFGSMGWLADLLKWGVALTDLHGIDLNEERVTIARRRLPGADLRVGDAVALPWPDESFHLVILSTVFSSIFDDAVRRRIADEVVRVLRGGGAVLWYDAAYDNPRNPNIRRVTRSNIVDFFPTLSGRFTRVTLAPPLIFAVAERSWLLATLLDSFPFLRSHWLAILVKGSDHV